MSIKPDQKKVSIVPLSCDRVSVDHHNLKMGVPSAVPPDLALRVPSPMDSTLESIDGLNMDSTVDFECPSRLQSRVAVTESHTVTHGYLYLLCFARRLHNSTTSLLKSATCPPLHSVINSFNYYIKFLSSNLFTLLSVDFMTSLINVLNFLYIKTPTSRLLDSSTIFPTHFPKILTSSPHSKNSQRTCLLNTSTNASSPSSTLTHEQFISTKKLSTSKATSARRHLSRDLIARKQSSRDSPTREQPLGDSSASAQEQWSRDNIVRRSLKWKTSSPAAVMMFLLLVNGVNGFKEHPRLTVPHDSEVLTVPPSDDVTLECPVVGTPTPIFEWSKDGESISEDGGWERLHVSRARLRISSTRHEDAGRYVCSAVNGFGKQNYTFTIIVNDPLAPPNRRGDHRSPVLLQVYPPSPGPAITKRVGHSAQFKCLVAGSPDPNVVWFKDGTPLPPSPLMSNSQGQHVLRVTSLQLRHSGLYTCAASNPHGAAAANWTLQVIGSVGPALTPVLAGLPLSVRNASVSVGEQEGVLTCSGTTEGGDPHVKWLRRAGSGSVVGDAPVIVWEGHQYAVLPPTSVREAEHGVFVTQLSIPSPKPEDAGEYVCTATTPEGIAFGHANLTVLPRGPGHVLPVVMGGLGSIAVIAVVTAVVATLRRRRHRRHPTSSTSNGGKASPPHSSQASASLLPTVPHEAKLQLMAAGPNGTHGASQKGSSHPASLQGGTGCHPASQGCGHPRYSRSPALQGRVGDSSVHLAPQDAMMMPARYQDPTSASVYLSDPHQLSPNQPSPSGGCPDYHNPPATPQGDYNHHHSYPNHHQQQQQPPQYTQQYSDCHQQQQQYHPSEYQQPTPSQQPPHPSPKRTPYEYHHLDVI